LQALTGCRTICWAHATPTLIVYDQGGYATATLRALAHEGVQAIGMQPTGHEALHNSWDKQTSCAAKIVQLHEIL
jgi:hypothetical protein